MMLRTRQSAEILKGPQDEFRTGRNYGSMPPGPHGPVVPGRQRSISGGVGNCNAGHLIVGARAPLGEERHHGKLGEGDNYDGKKHLPGKVIVHVDQKAVTDRHSDTRSLGMMTWNRCLAGQLGLRHFRVLHPSTSGLPVSGLGPVPSTSLCVDRADLKFKFLVYRHSAMSESQTCFKLLASYCTSCGPGNPTVTSICQPGLSLSLSLSKP